MDRREHAMVRDSLLKLLITGFVALLIGLYWGQGERKTCQVFIGQARSREWPAC